MTNWHSMNDVLNVQTVHSVSHNFVIRSVHMCPVEFWTGHAYKLHTTSSVRCHQNMTF